MWLVTAVHQCWTSSALMQRSCPGNAPSENRFGAEREKSSKGTLFWIKPRQIVWRSRPFSHTIAIIAADCQEVVRGTRISYIRSENGIKEIKEMKPRPPAITFSPRKEILIRDLNIGWREDKPKKKLQSISMVMESLTAELPNIW